LSLGPIMMDLRGLELEDDERKLLQDPLVGGIILFSRNFSDLDQLQNLTREIHALRKPPLLIAVDHEGGRVQRFRQGFCSLPACRAYGEIYDIDNITNRWLRISFATHISSLNISNNEKNRLAMQMWHNFLQQTKYRKIL